MAAFRAIELRFTERAQRHLDSILDYIRGKNPMAARSVGQRIHLAVDMSRYFPEAGRRGGRAEGTREWVVRGLPYIVVYEIIDVEQPRLVILGIFHGAQDERKI